MTEPLSTVDFVRVNRLLRASVLNDRNGMTEQIDAAFAEGTPAVIRMICILAGEFTNAMTADQLMDDALTEIDRVLREHLSGD